MTLKEKKTETKIKKTEPNKENSKHSKIENKKQDIIELKEIEEDSQKIKPYERIMVEVKKLNNYSYLVDKKDGMNVPLKIFASEKLMKKMQEDNCIQQGINVAHLPGIKGFSIMMPDAHQGYGFSIGGVAAFDHKCGCISPGGIGYDINCGVRLLVTNLTKDDVKDKIKPLLESLFKNIPPGVGEKSLFKLNCAETS